MVLSAWTHPPPPTCRIAVSSQEGICLLSRYHSPYATKKGSSRALIWLAVAFALVLGIGLGLAASGGLPGISLGSGGNKTPTSEAIAAVDHTATSAPTAKARSTSTAG